ncbi:unnamed protein product [Rhizophagus irregularis]|nr:unnamed protein product [Rhizophagus irregularis]
MLKVILFKINSTIQNSLNTQRPNAIYTSRSLNELFPTKQVQKKLEFDINDVQLVTLPKIDSTVQYSLNIQHLNVTILVDCQFHKSSRKRKIAEIEIETQDNDRKLAKLMTFTSGLLTFQPKN